MRTLIHGGLLSLPCGTETGDLLLDGEKISRAGGEIDAPDALRVDATGCVVLPGAIDTHTHFDLPVSGTFTADDFESGTRAALVGGTTTVLDFATQNKGHSLREAFDEWTRRLGTRAACDVGFHMAVTDWNANTSRELDDMTALGVTSYKFYLAYPALMVEDDAVFEALSRLREIGAIAGFHCENGRLVGALTKRLLASGRKDCAAHPLSRPPQVEAEAVERLLRVASLAQAPVNIVHLSSAEGLEAVRRGRARGQKVLVETCPQYLLLEDSLYDRDDGAKFVCSPPLRKQSDREALWHALSAGEIDTVGTDHCSFRYADQKAGKPDFTQIPNGMPGVEHRLAAMMTAGVETGRISLSRLTRLLCENPAKLFGLYPQKGALLPGADADVVIWDPQRKHVIRAREQTQRLDYTPYEGMAVCGGVRDVWLRGNHAVREGVWQGACHGRYVSRGKPVFPEN